MNSSDKSLSEFLSTVTGTPLVGEAPCAAHESEQYVPDLDSIHPVVEPGNAIPVNGLTLTPEQVEQIKADEQPIEAI